MRKRDIPTETCARNRHIYIEYVPKRVSYHYIITFISLERVCWQRCIPSDQCDMSESSFIHEYFLLTIYQFTNLHYKLIQIGLLSNPKTSPMSSFTVFHAVSALNPPKLPYTRESFWLLVTGPAVGRCCGYLRSLFFLLYCPC